jgi:hypothetical protein
VLAAASAKTEVLGKPVIVKTALELVQSVYRDPDLPLQVRLHAAIIAIAREAPPSSGVSDMSLEERRRRVEELMDRHRISWGEWFAAGVLTPPFPTLIEDAALLHDRPRRAHRLPAKTNSNWRTGLLRLIDAVSPLPEVVVSPLPRRSIYGKSTWSSGD